MFNFFLTIAAAGAGWLLGSMGTRRTVEQRIDERFADLERRLHAGGAAPSATTAAAPAAGPATAAVPPAPVRESAPATTPAPVAERPSEAEPSPEVLAVISAAICAFLGKPARIRRVRRIPSGVNPWAQVGRVSVMASHVLQRH